MSKKKKTVTLRGLVDDLAMALQRHVRLKAAVHENKGGYIKCVTCPAWHHWKDMQGGHWIERGKQATKLLEENIWPQCPGCNGFKMKYSTECRETYSRHMRDMYGDEQCDEWLRISNLPANHFRPEIEDELKRITRLNKELEAQL